MSIKKFFLITYGCQMNKSDSERIAAVLEKTGYKPTSDIKEADLIIVNACSVRQSAVDRIFGQCQKFNNLKKYNKKLRTILTGCILKKDRKRFAEKFDLVLNNEELPKIPKLLGIKNYKTRPASYFNITPKTQNSFRGYIPIIIGCNNFCSYCVVPYTRGREVSRPVEEILCEVKNLLERGCKEIWLLGENVNSYGLAPKQNFPKLLSLINGIPGDFWIRFTSPHPKDFSNELIKIIAKCKKVTKYINLPLQSGDDKILRKMNRPYTVKQYKSLVGKIRKIIPDVCLSTDVIVGYPGETKKQFENTLKLFKEIKFDMAYIAQYSERAGTAASKLKDDISHEEKEKRDKLLTKMLAETALWQNKKYIGKTIRVLPEEEIKESLVGKSEEYKTVKFSGHPNLIGKFVKVKVTGALPWGLRGCLK